MRVAAVLTDNVGAYRSRAWGAHAAQLYVSLKRTRPYTPRTNGKVERVIRTLLAEWAYARPYPTSARRAK